MRTRTLPFLLVLACIVPAAQAEARQAGAARDLDGIATRLGSVEAVNSSLHRAAQVYGGAGGDAVASGGMNRILTALVSTALGAGLGFFASQVVRGDWSDGPGQPQMNRGAWAGVGAAVGFAVGYSFPPTSRVHAVSSPVRPLVDRSVITFQEIENALAMNAYEAVRLLRPEWQLFRQPNTFGQGVPAKLMVYLDDFRLGGIETLQDLSASMIGSIRFIGAGKATARWGPGNSLGVIHVVMSGGVGPR